MKISKGFHLMNIAGENVVVPAGSKNINFNSMITLNDSGVFLWKQLQNEKTEEELLGIMQEEYEIDEVTAAEDLKKFIATLQSVKVID